MYYAIIGDIIFDRDENLEKVALIYSHFCTVVGESYEEVEEIASWIYDRNPTKACDYVVPQSYPGDIVNYTDKCLVVGDGYYLNPNSRLEWSEIQKREEAYAEIHSRVD